MDRVDVMVVNVEVRAMDITYSIAAGDSEKVKLLVAVITIS